MSTGADCQFYEAEPGHWFYKLQQWPYGEWPKYDTFGPFPTYRVAYRHLTRNHANPGAFGVSPLPGCKHLLKTPLQPVESNNPQGYTHECDQCGQSLKL